MNPGLMVQYGPQRPWSSRWFDIQQQLEAVEAACQPRAYKGNAPLKLAFENFFTQCYHFADWLWDDTSTGLSKTTVRAYIATNAALNICAGFSNTAKHRTRQKTSDMTAVISSVGYNATGVQVVVSWAENGASGTEDALHLAQDCVAAWQTFLKTHSLRPPI